MAWDEEVKKKLGSCGTGVKIGDGVFFAYPELCHLGNNVRIDRLSTITVGLHTGNNVQITVGAVLGGGKEQKIHMGDWTFIGYHSHIFTASESYDHLVNEYWHHGKNVKRGDVYIADYAGIASGVTVMPGVIIPDGCHIGANSFVYSGLEKGKLDPWSIYHGNPLNKIRSIDEDMIKREASEAEKHA